MQITGVATEGKFQVKQCYSLKALCYLWQHRHRYKKNLFIQSINPLSTATFCEAT